MSAFRSIGSWASSWVEYFTPQEDNPSRRELMDAMLNASAVVHCLEDLACDAKFLVAHHRGLAELTEEVRQALSDDTGGTPPHEVLRFWYEQRCRGVADRKTFATSEEKQAMVKVWERWNNRDTLKKEFWGLHLFEGPDYQFRRPLNEQRMQDGEERLQDWLKKHRVGKTN